MIFSIEAPYCGVNAPVNAAMTVAMPAITTSTASTARGLGAAAVATTGADLNTFIDAVIH